MRAASPTPTLVVRATEGLKVAQIGAQRRSGALQRMARGS